MFASIVTLLAITVDRYLYIVKPLRYSQVVTLRRVIFAVAAIWMTACCLFIVWCIHVRSYGVDFRSYCYIPDSIHYFTVAFCGYLPLILIFLLNIYILSVARKQRKRISWIFRRSKSSENICHCRRGVNVLHANSNCDWADNC